MAMAILDAGREIHLCQSGLRANDGEYQSGSRCWASFVAEVPDARDIAPVVSEVREALKQRGKWFWAAHRAPQRRNSGPYGDGLTTLPDGGTIYVSHDITEQLSAQRARADTETKYRMLIEQVAAISYIAELGINGQWLYVSPQVETMFGYSAEEWLSSREIGYVTPYRRSPHHSCRGRSLRTRRTLPGRISRYTQRRADHVGQRHGGRGAWQ